MSVFKIYLFVSLSCFLAATVDADIYQWTDANGVQHFTNYAPRDGARIIAKTSELPFDETADHVRREQDRQPQFHRGPGRLPVPVGPPANRIFYKRIRIDEIVKIGF